LLPDGFDGTCLGLDEEIKDILDDNLCAAVPERINLAISAGCKWYAHTLGKS
jgi:hypothetical protein